MLTSETIKKINDFVYIKPRTIEEVSKYLKKNWRTADRYIQRIESEQGTIASRTFREGTRGALKIVYWSAIEKTHLNSVQQHLFEKIKVGRNKEDFSPFDIWQYLDKNKKDAVIETASEEDFVISKDAKDLLRGCEKQMLIFSGRLVDFNLIIEDIKDIAKRNVQIKVLANVDIISIDKVKSALAINNKIGKETIEIRHSEQPLRAWIFDKKITRFKEIKRFSKYKKGKKIVIFYTIYDSEWIDWIQKVFWNMFSTATPAEKRITELERIYAL